MQNQKSKLSIPFILAIVGLCLACICLSVIVFFFMGSKISNWFNSASPTKIVSSPSFSLEVTPTDLAEWTVIVYSDADDEVLEGSMWFDVNEMELVGSSPQVNIIVQMDRNAGAWSRDGDWTSARRIYITQDSDLSAIYSPVIEDLGEVDMGNPQTLTDFVSWAVINYPATKYALIMSDHGGGWTGGFTDGSSGSKLSIPEILGSLNQVRANTGLDKFELFGFDACLMGQIEIYGTFYPISNYMVASEEVIPSFGWAYAGWLDQLIRDPSMDGGGLGRAIVSSYVITDVIMTETRATEEDIIQSESTTTLSAVESARVPDLIYAMNQFINVLATLDQGLVAEARTYTRSFYSIFGEDSMSPYLDLYNFAEVLASATGDPAVEQASIQLQEAIFAAVVAEKHGTTMSGSNGVSFYFPDSSTYVFTELNDSFEGYSESVSTFLKQSSWDEFMAFHYLEVAYVPQEGVAYLPSKTSEVVAPGASELTIGPIQISDTEISGDDTVTVLTTVTGNVAYIFTVLYYYDPDGDSYWVGDISYYIADNTIEIGGVNYPDYGASPVPVEYEWSPTLYILTDGTHEAYALFEPAEYLSSDYLTVYAVYGQYTSLEGTTPVDAVLYFDADGNYLYAYAFPDNDGDGASTPVEIQPKSGDQFTDYVQYILFDEEDMPYYEYSLSDDVWTWGAEPFSFYAAYPVDGEYAVGIQAYDFDNNFVESYEYITYQR